MRLVIAGSRTIKDEKAHLLIREGLVEYDLTPTEIISGEAEGVDTAAREYAHDSGIDFVGMPGNWKGKGRAAGYKRNQKMAWYAKQASFYLKHAIGIEEIPPTYLPGLLAIWDGKSKGTAHMIDIARLENIPVFIYPRPPEESA